MIDPRAIPVRFSRLKRIAQSPQHYWHACQQDDSHRTAATGLGSAVHSIAFGQPVSVYEGAVRRGKAWEEWQAEHGEGLVLTATEHGKAMPIVEALRHDPIAGPLLFSGERIVEVPIDWTTLGRACRGTPDVVGPSVLIDLKTAAKGQPEKFQRDAGWFGYHAQLAWYHDGLHSLDGRTRECLIVCVESTPPYPVTVHRLTERTIEQGRRLCRLWLERLLACEAADEWPGYTQGVIDWDAPDIAGETVLMIDGEEVAA